MADEPHDDQQSGNPDPTTYYRLVDGGLVARLRDGWEREVFHPNKNAWVPIDVNFATETWSLSKEEALAETGGEPGAEADASE